MTIYEDFADACVTGMTPEEIALYGGVAQDMGILATKNDPLLEVIVQNYRGGARFDLAEAWVFAQVLYRVRRGEMDLGVLNLGREPGPDAAVEDNTKALRSGLAENYSGVSGVVWGGYGPFDGLIEWEVPLRFQRNFDPPGESHRIEIVEHPAGSAPLEIGYQSAARTWIQLLQSKCLARWPYGHTRVYLLDLGLAAWDEMHPSSRFREEQ